MRSNTFLSHSLLIMLFFSSFSQSLSLSLPLNSYFLLFPVINLVTNKCVRVLGKVQFVCIDQYTVKIEYKQEPISISTHIQTL